MIERDTYNILIVTDDEAMRHEFARLLTDEPADRQLAPTNGSWNRNDAGGATVANVAARPRFLLDVATHGQAALSLSQQAKRAAQPYAVAFVDLRLAPSESTVATTHELWRDQEDLNLVVFADASQTALSELSTRLGNTDRLFALSRRLDVVEAPRLAAALCEKWRLAGEVRRHIEELTRARVDAEAAGMAKSQFLANMSHEIRTPMTAILGYAEILREEDLPREQQLAHLDTICHSGEHLLHILSEVLDISKIEADRVQFESLSFSPVRLLRQAVAILRGSAVEKGLALDLVFDGLFPHEAVGDPTRIQQILLNLIGNAVKFTAAGHVHVHARVVRGRHRPADLQVAVQDSGIGIPADRLPGLFALFAQADASTTRRFGGTGLGLVIARRLARAMGGDIRVQSEPGRGSCFTVTLPLANPDDGGWSEASAAPADPGSSVAATVAAAATVAGRVLLVDDAADNLQLVARHLRRAGAEVVTANDGEQALTEWASAQSAGSPFDLIVSDLQMPQLDGYALVRALRARRSPAPILILSANALPTERVLALQAGADDYLSKPVDRKKLLSTCARLLSRPSVSSD